MEIATALPVIFPSMTQAQVDAIISPVPGMVQYNTTANKLQVYSNQDIQNVIANELYSGTEDGGFNPHDQSIMPNVSGNIVAVEVLVRQVGPFLGFIDVFINGVFNSEPMSNYSSLTWHTIYLTNPVPITAGFMFNLHFAMGADELSFATNSNYLDGSGCCFPGQDDMLFRIHIETPGGLVWVNMH